MPHSKAADGRRRSAGKPSLLVTLSLSPSRLRDVLAPALAAEDSLSSKASSDTKDGKQSPAASNLNASHNLNGETASDSNAATPAEGTPAPSVMGPPTDSSKKKGSKRSSAALQDGGARARSKPGPKKKSRLDDGSMDPATGRPSGHKLGPKANQGAINAGLRALDRSGKPCRKWARGGFTLKSFTGVVWGVSRWTAPPKMVFDPSDDGSAAPSLDNSSSKENKEDNHGGNSASHSNSNSNIGADVDMQSIPSINPSSPAPVPIAAAS